MDRTFFEKAARLTERFLDPEGALERSRTIPATELWKGAPLDTPHVGYEMK